MKTETVTVTATWRSTHTFTVPADALDRANVGELGQLLDLIKSDPDGEGDITAECAELVDWSVR
jgi:hypothetical protein